ncbi:hypothetical protein IPP75_02910 [Candidatus Saccharibacteria bacterium]|nr:MAG: hypothetical protein IPP75_02910 [Candidatus Saccharibacteria bacterium]
MSPAEQQPNTFNNFVEAQDLMTQKITLKPESAVNEFVGGIELPAALEAEHIMGHNQEALATFRSQELRPEHEVADAAEAAEADPGFNTRSEGERALLETIIDEGRFVLKGTGINPPPGKQARRRGPFFHEGMEPKGATLESKKAIETDGNDSILAAYLDASPNATELAGYIDMIPPVSADIARRIVEKIATTGLPNDMWRALGRFPETATDSGFMAAHFKYPDEIAKLAATKSYLLSSTANMFLRHGTAVESAAQLYEDEPDESRRSRMLHYIDVLNNPRATEVSRRFANSILRLGRTEEIGEITYGSVAHGAVTTYRPEQNVLRDVPVPLASRLPESLRTAGDIPEKSLTTMTDEERTICLKDEYVQVHKGTDGRIEVEGASLSDLRGEYQELVLGERVQNAYEKSQSQREKAERSQANRENVESGARLIQEGDLIHTTSDVVTRNILQSGLVCGELAAEVPDADAFPFNVDFYRIDDVAVNFPDVVSAVSSRVHERSVTFVLSRDAESQTHYPDRLADVTAGDDNRHRLILGAVPSTEVKAIVCHQGSSLDELKKEIAKNKMYIPVIDNKGKILFTPEEFDAMPETSYEQGGVSNDAFLEGLAGAAENYRNSTPPWLRSSKTEELFI